MKKIINFVFIISTLSASSQISFAADNFCEDREANAAWMATMLKHEGLPEYQELNTLRNNLCLKVENGDLTPADAQHQFEAAWVAIDKQN